MKFEYISNNTPPKDDEEVTVKITGEVTEVRHCKMNRTAPIKKLNSEEYVDMKSGEVCLFERREKRVEDVAGLKQTFS